MYFHGDRSEKRIALTFDDGPSEQTGEILDILKKYEVKVTFFIVGKMVNGREEILRQAAAEGHEFGNHTFSHRRLWFKSKKEIEDEIKRCDDELARVSIHSPFIRFPGLKFGPNALSVCKRLNKKIIFSDFISLNQFAYDLFRPWLHKIGLLKGEVKIDDVINHTVRKTKNGSILTFHDYLQEIGPNYRIAEIIDRIIPQLKQNGFEFVRISELIEK